MEIDRMEVRRLYALVKYLPPEAALWRVQEPQQPSESKAAPRGERIKTSDPEVIRATLKEWGVISG